MIDPRLRTVLRHLRRVARTDVNAGPSDAHLLERFAAQRDEAAFELLVWRHGPMVLGVCRRVLRHEPDTEDAFQATFLALLRKAGSIGKRAPVGSWLYKVAHRAALTARAAAAAHEQRAARPDLAAEPPGAEW